MRQRVVGGNNYSLMLRQFLFIPNLLKTLYSWKCMLDFIKYVFGTYQHYHMVFLLLACSYADINGFLNVESSLRSWK